MTLGSNKTSLPYSQSGACPEYPATSYHWRYALQDVKIAYLKGQWKSCCLQCDKLLYHNADCLDPLNAVYLYFYCALSLEATARQLGHLSATKIESLELSREYFQHAATSLPGPFIIYNDDDGCSITLSESDFEGSLSLDDSASSVEVSSSRNGHFTPATEESESLFYEHQAKPAPIQFQKSTQLGFWPTQESGKCSNIEQPTTNYHKSTLKQATHKPSTPPRASGDLFESLDTWISDAAYRRWNELRQEFSQMLEKHITYIDELLVSTRKAQAARYAPSLGLVDDDDDGSRNVGIKARILQLRARKWERERFMPERYQALCEKALEEI